MDTLKKIFPLSFNAADTKKFVINLLIYIFAPGILGFVIGFVGGLLSVIPVVGAIVSLVVTILGYAISAYGWIGLILLILVFAKVIK